LTTNSRDRTRKLPKFDSSSAASREEPTAVSKQPQQPTAASNHSKQPHKKLQQTTASSFLRVLVFAGAVVFAGDVAKIAAAAAVVTCAGVGFAVTPGVSLTPDATAASARRWSDGRTEMDKRPSGWSGLVF
jgi:hypothetical protein